MKGFLWFSSSSDTTGPQLAEKIGFEAGKSTPDFEKYSVLVGWGCKPGTKYSPDALKRKVTDRSLRVLNHPEAIIASRDKLGLLTKLHAANIAVPGFVKLNLRNASGTPLTGAVLVSSLEKQILDAVKEGKLDFPLSIGNRFNKGEPVFCLTAEDVSWALRNGTPEELEFARSFCPGTEFRIHVFRDYVLFAEQKHLAKDPYKATAEGFRKKLIGIVGKGKAAGAPSKETLESSGITWILTTLAREAFSAPNHMQRSVARGWEIAEVVGAPGDPVKALAIRAVEAAGLDMGAVSVVVDGSTFRVTNITASPSLDESQQARYAKAILSFAGEKVKEAAATGTVKREAGGETSTAKAELIAKIKRRVGNLSQAKAEAIAILLEGEE